MRVTVQVGREGGVSVNVPDGAEHVYVHCRDAAEEQWWVKYFIAGQWVEDPQWRVT